MDKIDLSNFNIFDYIEDIDSFIDEWFEVSSEAHKNSDPVIKFTDVFQLAEIARNPNRIHTYNLESVDDLNIKRYICQKGFQSAIKGLSVLISKPMALVESKDDSNMYQIDVSSEQTKWAA